MIRWDSRDPIPDCLRGAVLALGNFDGFHKGHQAVVNHALQWAHAEARPIVVATFDPHPVRYFRSDAAPFHLTTLEQREVLLGDAGADAMLVFHFDRAIAEMPASEWVIRELAGNLGVRGVVIGEGFAFGKGRHGTPALLAEAGAAFGIGVKAVSPIIDDGRAVSSSRIRSALDAGDCITAERLLTRPFAIRGELTRGEKIGRGCGFLVATLDFGTFLCPASGVYDVSVRTSDGGALSGVAAPMACRGSGPSGKSLELYFPEGDEPVFSGEIEVEFHRLIRAGENLDPANFLGNAEAGLIHS